MIRNEIMRDFLVYVICPDIEEAEKFLFERLQFWLEKDITKEERGFVLVRLRQLRMHIEVREICKLETGMAAMPEKIKFWKNPKRPAL